MYDILVDDIIRKFGFEDNRTICFCSIIEMVEKGDFEENDILNVTKFYKYLMNEEEV